MKFFIYFSALIAFIACTQIGLSGNAPNYDYRCFKWTLYGDIFHYRSTFNDTRFQYFTGYSLYQGRRNGILYGHRDSATNHFTFAIVFENSHTALFQFTDYGVGSQMSVVFGTNRTSLRNPSDAEFQWVPCYKKSEQQSYAQISLEKEKLSSQNQDFNCIQNSRWKFERWYFIPTSELKISFPLLGYDLNAGMLYGHVAGFYDKVGTWTLMTMYADRWKARFFVFDKYIPANGIDYGVTFENEGSYFDFPTQAYFHAC